MPTHQELRAAFDAFDMNQDGLISSSELSTILTRKGETSKSRGASAMTQAEAAELIALFDSNGDGQLDLAQFIAMMSSEKAVPSPTVVAGVGSAFDFLDDCDEWVPITDRAMIDALGELSAYNQTTEVQYAFGGHTYKAWQDPEGNIVQNNVEWGTKRDLRLVPFFFEFEEADSGEPHNPSRSASPSESTGKRQSAPPYRPPTPCSLQLTSAYLRVLPTTALQIGGLFRRRRLSLRSPQ